MSEYERSTRRCAFDDLRSELRAGLRDYFMTHEMTGIDEASLVCCETLSTRKQAHGLLAWLDGQGRIDTRVYTVIVLGVEDLLWARVGEPYSPVAHVTRAHLGGIRVKFYDSLLAQDSGLEIAGLIEGSKGVLRGYIGLGPQAEAREFCEQVAHAVEVINPKPKGMWPGWMSGK